MILLSQPCLHHNTIDKSFLDVEVHVGYFGYLVGIHIQDWLTEYGASLLAILWLGSTEFLSSLRHLSTQPHESLFGVGAQILP